MTLTDAVLLVLLLVVAAAALLLLLRTRAHPLAELHGRLDNAEALAAARASLAAAEDRIRTGEANEARLAAALAGAQEAAATLRAEHAVLGEQRAAERREAGEKIALLREAREEMARHFKLMADEAMTRHGESFTRLNREGVDAVLGPLREKLGEFEQRLTLAHNESTRERATLGEQIRAIGEANATLGREARDLTEALRGRSQLQGAWGEMILARILESSGLRAGEEYELQRSFTGEEGRLRPDAIVHLPGGQHVVIDSKVSLLAYASLCAGEGDEAALAGFRARHLDSVRAHIRALAAKEYHAATGGGLDCVLMFVPIEGALAAALVADRDLIGFALERNVTLVTPTTLTVALRTIRSVWQGERRTRNAEEIAERAGKLYDKFVAVVADMQMVGDNLGRTRQSWDAAMGKLTTGRGNVLGQVEKLRLMGARTSKTLPEPLLLAAAAAEDELATEP